MQPDLTHIERQIRDNQLTIKRLRQKAQLQRDQADQNRQAGNARQAENCERLALEIEQEVETLEETFTVLETQKEKTQTHIVELKQQKIKLTQEYEAKSRQIDNEIAKLQGTTLML